MSLKDAARVDALLDELVRRGIVEQVGEDVHASRLWKASLQKAAEVLNRQVAETGFAPPGHPIRLAVEKALAMRAERFAEEDRADVVALLVQLELAHMSEGERQRLAAYGPP